MVRKFYGGFINEIVRLDLGGVNAYLIKGTDSFILVDTGGYTFTDRPLNDRCKLLDEKLVENGCTPETLGCVFLTHGDIDHITNCQYVKEKYNAKIFIHKEDIRLTKDLTAEKIFSLKANDLSAEILYLPGHTMGYIGILFDNGSLIIGDTLSNTKRPDYAMNAIDFKLLKKSVAGLKNRNIKTVYPGHGDPFLFTDFKY